MISRKKTLLACVIAGVVIVAGYAVSHYMEKKVSYNAVGSPLIAISDASSTQTSLSQDADKDGLADWEEVLWKTDPNNPDTDGDGTPDGEEVLLNRNPIVKGPNDKLEASPTESDKTTPLTATEKVSQDVLQAYITLKQSGASQADLQKFSLQAILDKNQVSITASQYTPSQFRQTGDDEITVRAYGNNVGLILIKHIPQNGQNEVVIFKNSLEKDDPSKLAGLKTIVDNYEGMVKDLAALEVPKSALIIHTDLVNSLSSVANSIAAMEAVYTDAMTALAGMQKYQTTAPLVRTYLKDLEAYFTDKGMQFTDTEPGYVISKSIGI